MKFFSLISHLFHVLIEIKWKYLFWGSYVRIGKGASFYCGKNSSIRHSHIILVSGTVRIFDCCLLENCSLYVKDGFVSLGNNSFLRGKPKLNINVEFGRVSIEDHCRIDCSSIWIRFNGSLTVGQYTNINSGSEIRSDEQVSIGSFCQISYDVNIWDTNTHVILEPARRAEVTKKYFPYFGFEESKPDTKPVIIHNGCWIGKGATIMRGSVLGDNSIVGSNTLIIGKRIDPDTTVVEDVVLKVFPNNYQIL